MSELQPQLGQANTEEGNVSFWSLKTLACEAGVLMKADR